jgi:hypothetical protein
VRAAARSTVQVVCLRHKRTHAEALDSRTNDVSAPAMKAGAHEGAFGEAGARAPALVAKGMKLSHPRHPVQTQLPTRCMHVEHARRPPRRRRPAASAWQAAATRYSAKCVLEQCNHPASADECE